MNRKQLVLFNGSPRKAKTSYVFARAMKELAEKKVTRLKSSILSSISMKRSLLMP